MSKWNKFVLLMWKNWLLTKRARVRFLAEILIPVVLSLLLVAVRSVIDSEPQPELHYDPVNVNAAFGGSLAYSPCGNDEITNLLNAFSTKKCYPNGMELESDYYKNPFDAAIVFDDKYANQTVIDDKISVKLRFPSNSGKEKTDWFTELLYPLFQTPGPRTNDDPDYTNFLSVQLLLSKAFSGKSEGDIPSSIQIQEYPYPKYVKDLFYNTAMFSTVALLVMLSFMYNFINVVKLVTTEKENQLKESMKVMGLPGWLHWTAWFIRSFIIVFIVVLLITIIVKVNFKTEPVFKHSDPTLLFVFFLIYACSVICFGFCVTVFFSKANTATAVGGLLYFISYLPFALQSQTNTLLGVGNRLACSLLSNSGVSYGLSVALNFEALEKGVQWKTLFTPVTSDDQLTFGSVMLILLLDIVIYMLIALYVEAIFPGEFGIAQPWYFPFTKDYWRGSKTNAKVEDNSTMKKSEFIEEFNEQLPAGIQLKNLTKIFGGNTAVNQINLNMYEGQITVLLGHNGAGKTTTMSMITGMFPPTSGTAIVSNYDVRTNIQHVRDSMGICLQHNVLFDELTVEEHIRFFGKLKGLTNSEVNAEIDTYISLLELKDKRKTFSSALSGGMKRKLSVAISLCGNSKVVMLDEPTAGMDPSARRAVWELLQKQKTGRTILLTTHFMDEADLLGDRIAIMSAGEIQCVGTSFFLKKKYGAGYYLIMDVKQSCNPKNVTNLLQKHIPSIQMQACIGSELSYLLLESESSKFESMLSDLENNFEKLNINGYGISLTTLEEVFMKVGADHLNESSQNAFNETQVSVEPTSFKTDLVSGPELQKNQFHATFYKKLMSTYRNWLMTIVQVLVPVALIILSVLTSRNNVPGVKFKALPIHLQSYTDTVTLLEGDSTSPYYVNYQTSIKKLSELKETEDVSQTIISAIKSDPGNVKLHYIIGAKIQNNQLIAWYNNDPYHSRPLALQMVLNTLLPSGKSLEIINHPMPLSLEAQANQLSFNVAGVQLALQLGYALAFVASFYVLLCVKERMSKSKHLQFVSGMNLYTYWGATYLYDIISYIVIGIFIIITILALQEEGFRSFDEIGRLILLLLFYGLNVLPCVYLLSFYFDVPATGFAKILFFGSILCTAGLLIMTVLEMPSLELLYVAHPIHWVLLFTPFYPVAKGIADLSTIYSNRQICSRLNVPGYCFKDVIIDCCDLDYFSMSIGIGRNVIISFVMTVVFIGAILLIESGIFRKMRKTNQEPQPLDNMEEDVVEENLKIRSSSKDDLKSKYALVLENLTKYYKNFLAVNGLCLGVKQFECFGLLGVNGAGKTTTFKMMTGDEAISYGDAWVNGISIKSNLKEVQKYIGYCPQFDALLDNLTARETLKIFSLIRGVPKNQCNSLAENLAHQFDFFRHLDKEIKQLSGGNKRKLSTAIALIGDPPVIYLDEPTTGMDPATKRFLWQALCKIRDSGKTIILTSHSMEECEALCTRLAIMVNGTFKCLGSTQRLKNKFAQGYALTIKLKKHENLNSLDKEVEEIEAFVRREFPQSNLKEKHQQLLTYNLYGNSIPWSKMFGILEQNKQRLNIEDYSLGQSSLEQVFLSFTQHQSD